MSTTLHDVIGFVRKFTGEHRAPINENTWLEADLGISGDDGVEFLEEAAQVFGVVLYTEEDGYRFTFDLQQNEYIFTSEGLDLLGMSRLINWLRGMPRPVICDLSVGHLYEVLVEARQQKNAENSMSPGC
ncbi:TPA: hypothetical protein ACKP1B_003815 [Serratia fonticola]